MLKRELIVSSVINLALVILGIMLIFSSINAIDIIIDVLGIALIAAGLFGFVAIFVSKTKEGAGAILSSALLLIVGLLLMIFSKQLGSFILVLIPIVIGVWALVTGVVGVSRALQVKKQGSAAWWAPLAVSVIYIVLAVIVITHIGGAASLFSTLVGIFLIIMGILGLCSTGMSASLSKKYNLK